MHNAIVQRRLADAGHQQLNGREGHDLGVDVHGAQHRAAAARLRRVVKAQQSHVLRHGLTDGEQRAHRVPGHKVVGADEHVGQHADRVEPLGDLILVVVADAASLVHLRACHQHRAAKGGIALEEGLAVMIVADKADPLFPLAQHIVDKAHDLGGVVHIQLVGRQGKTVLLGRTVHEQDREPELAHHFVIGAVEHLDADDRLDLVGAEREGKTFLFQIGGRDAVGVHRIAELRDLALKFIQHRRGKVRLGQKRARQQRDLALITGNRRGCGGCGDKGAEIGKLLIAHLHRLLQDLFPRGLGQSLRVVDGLGNRVAGDPQRVRDILDRYLLFHLRPSVLSFY